MISLVVVVVGLKGEEESLPLLRTKREFESRYLGQVISCGARMGEEPAHQLTS